MRSQNHSKKTCEHCTSWRLLPLGLGVDRISEEIANIFSEAQIFRIDSDSTTHKKAQIEAQSFYDTKGSILVGTEMMLGYLRAPISTVAVISIDSLFSLPDFRMNDKIFHFLIALRKIASDDFLVQTRMPEEAIFDHALKGNISEYHDSEIASRKEFGYPPFSVFIKISFHGTKEDATRASEEMAEVLSEYKPDIFPAFIERIKGKFTVNGLIKLPRERWVDPELLELLLSLPASFEIRVDPESLL